MTKENMLDKVSQINRKLDMLYDSTITSDYDPTNEIQNLKKEKENFFVYLEGEGVKLSYIYGTLNKYRGEVND